MEEKNVGFIGQCWSMNQSVDDCIDLAKDLGMSLDKVEVTAHYEALTKDFDNWCKDHEGW